MARSDYPHGIAETGYQVHRLTEMYYDKQSTNENREFRREFKQSQNSYQPTYQATQATSQTTQPEEANDCYDMDYNDEFDTNSKNL